jgi:hypothetical protein
MRPVAPTFIGAFNRNDEWCAAAHAAILVCGEPTPSEVPIGSSGAAAGAATVTLKRLRLGQREIAPILRSIRVCHRFSGTVHPATTFAGVAEQILKDRVSPVRFVEIVEFCWLFRSPSFALGAGWLHFTFGQFVVLDQVIIHFACVAPGLMSRPFDHSLGAGASDLGLTVEVYRTAWGRPTDVPSATAPKIIPTLSHELSLM